MKYRVTRTDVVSYADMIPKDTKVRIGDCATLEEAYSLVDEFIHYDWCYHFEINGHDYSEMRYGW